MTEGPMAPQDDVVDIHLFSSHTPSRLKSLSL